MKTRTTFIATLLLLATATLVNGQDQNLPPDVRADTLSRLSPVNRDDLDDYGKSVFDRVVGRYNAGPITGPAAFSPHMPRVADGMDLINQYLRYDSKLGRKNIEIAIIVAARAFDQQYEWASHAPTALNEGASQDTVDAIAHGHSTEGLPKEDSLIIRYGRELFEDNHVSSATWAEAVSLFGQQGALEIAAIMGDYAMAAVILNAIDQHVPADRPARLPAD